MTHSTNDQVEGKFHEVKGAIKEKVGQVKKDAALETEGRKEKHAGQLLKKVGEIEKVFDK